MTEIKQETPLSQEECDTLAGLMSRAEWPLPAPVFHALMRLAVSVPIELGVFNKNGEVLMINRKDAEYDGWHMPGTVLCDPESVQDAIRRLRSSEVAGHTTPPVPLGYIEIEKGVGYGKDTARHQISLLHVCWLVGEYSGPGQFFATDRLPNNILTHHRKLLTAMLQRLGK